MTNTKTSKPVQAKDVSATKTIVHHRKPQVPKIPEPVDTPQVGDLLSTISKVDGPQRCIEAMEFLNRNWFGNEVIQIIEDNPDGVLKDVEKHLQRMVGSPAPEVTPKLREKPFYTERWNEELERYCEMLDHPDSEDPYKTSFARVFEAACSDVTGLDEKARMQKTSIQVEALMFVMEMANASIGHLPRSGHILREHVLVVAMMAGIAWVRISNESV